MKKNILITGAASGIGRATAIYFAREGWFTGLYDLDEEGLRKTAEMIGQDFCIYRKLDVSDAGDFHSAMKHFNDHINGQPDVIFNNAGVLFMGPHMDIPEDKQHLTLDVNLRGVVNGINAAIPYMLDKPGSRIINMSSASAIYGSAQLSVYSATKFGVRGITEALNLELEERGIWVCDIMAPYVATPMLEKDQKAYSVEKVGVKVKPEDVAEVVWKAAHKKKLHWFTKGTGLLVFLERFLPSGIKRKVFKSLLMPG